MQKLKHGDRVTCEIGGTKIDDARISVDRDGDYFICNNKGCNGFGRPDNMFDYKYFYMFTPEDPENEGVTNLTVAPRTLDDLMVGDEIELGVIYDTNGRGINFQGKRTVLTRLENLVALSSWDQPNSFWFHQTIQKLKEEGYTLVQSIEEPIEELTMEEVCKRLGKRVKIKK